MMVKLTKVYNTGVRISIDLYLKNGKCHGRMLQLLRVT